MYAEKYELIKWRNSKIKYTYTVIQKDTNPQKALLIKSLAMATSDNQRKLISMFKLFMERSIVPCIRNNNPPMLDWQNFSSLLSQEPLDYDKLRIFLDSKLPSSPSIKMFPSTTANTTSVSNGLNSSRRDITTNDNKPFNPSTRYIAPNGPKEASQSTESMPVHSFNMNKTFGGERAKFGVFPLKNQTRGANQLDRSTNLGSQGGFQKALKGLQLLQQSFRSNQQQFEQSLSRNPGSMGISVNRQTTKF